jgi:LacI family transcriptional regulator
MKAQPYRVVLLLYTNYDYDRLILQGIARYARLHGPWVFCTSGNDPLLPLPLNESHNLATFPKSRSKSRLKISLPFLKKWGATGIIGRIQTAELLDDILEARLPAVVLDPSSEQVQPGKPLAGIPQILPDSRAVGRLAAEHFLERGFRNFAFCGYAGRLWSDLRAQGFRDRLDEACFPCHLYDAPRKPSLQTWNRERLLVCDWIRGLQKPLGIMACNDIRGCQILDACLMGGFKVPEEVAVLGVDNDSLLCNLSDPPLSSIGFNCEKAGYHAAELLEGQMAGETVDSESILVKSNQVHVRRSTDVIAIADPHVAESMRFIRENVRRSIGVEDVLERVKISRRALEIRFQQSLGSGIREEIQRVRINLAKQFLIETDLSFGRIAEIVGFNDLTYLSRVFHKVTGTTMLKFRRENGQR